MLRSETVITAIVLSAVALVVLALYRRFRRQTVQPLYALLAAAGVGLGLLVVISGAVHNAAVVGGAVSNHKPYDVRLVWLITIGLILMYTGTLNLALTPWVVRAQRWALAMSAATTTLLVVFLVSLLAVPALPDDAVAPLLVLHGPYLALLLVGLARAGQLGAPTKGA